MKMKPCNHPKNQGSVLMISLCIATIVGIVLGSYLYLIRAQNVSVMRSQYWNAAMTVAEAGVEEALAQINPGAARVPDLSTLSANGWGPPDANGTYSMPLPTPRSLANGYYYKVSYVAATPQNPPVITSTGYVTVPITGDTISRIVAVGTTNISMFSYALVVKTALTMNGNNTTINSYDSAIGIYGGSNVKSNGNIATKGGNLDIGNGNIYGTVHIGATASWSKGKNGLITGNDGVPINDMNIDIPDVQWPYGTKAPPPSKPVNGTNYTYVLSNGNKYEINSSKGLQSSDTLYVFGGATAYLYVDKSADLTGVIVQPGGKLIVYVGGPSLTISGANLDGNPQALQVYGLPGVTSVDIGGNGAFNGVLYAPEADAKFNGGGNNTIDIQGSLVVNSLTLNGHFNLHYDENLPANTPPLGYRVAFWKEL